MPQPLMKLKTVLGDDVLKFRTLSANEEMSRLFEFSVLALSDDNTDIDTAALLDTDAVVTIRLGDDSERHYHGKITQAGLESAVGKKIGWRLTLRPWLWKLTRRVDSRIFQNLNVEAILKKVFEIHPGDVAFELGNYPPRPYCVQYRESDFDFASRLMEEEGIYYYFRHDADKHTLVICDKMTSHGDFPGHGKIKYREAQDQTLDLEAITEWRHEIALTSGKVTLTDYDFTRPPVSLMVEHKSPEATPDADLEHYDYPGLYTDQARGRALARVRQQELDAAIFSISGASTTVGALAVGYRFLLDEHPLAKENTDHVVLATRVEAEYADSESGQNETRFSCRFRAMRYAHVFRPERRTPRPVIPGPQTAVVVGPAGEEIHTDEYGRVKVQFHWDRLGAKDEKSSCWLRVSSGWAGKAWGMISLPRIGQEVVVGFLEGDPDQPLVTGRVYNAVQVAPYALPENKTVSTIKSQSSVGGTTANANELRFQDKKGREHIWFQAEKNMRHLVKNCSWTSIRKDEHRIVGGKLLESIGGDHHWTVGADVRAKAGANYFLQAGATMWLQSADFTFKSGDVMWESDDTQFGLKNLEINMDGAAKIKAAQKISLKAPMIVIEADAKLSLKVGGNFVDISQAGVAINGTMVLVNSGGAAGTADEPNGVAVGPLSDPDKPGEPRDPLTPAA